MTDSQFPSSLFPSELNIHQGEEDPARNTMRSIGAILVDKGLITMDDTSRVIELQREQKIRFGEAAVKLGLISEGDLRDALSYQYQYAYLLSANGKHTSDELVAAYKPFSPEVDQLRAIRSQLMLRWRGKSRGRAMLAIVGAGRAQGTTYLAANLAVVFAQLGEKTLLIDADMHAPRQHALFQLNNQLGFSSLLAGRSDVASVLHTISFMPNLDVIPAGPIPPNPQELLNRDNLAELLDWAGKTYDIVLIDTPSMSTGADSTLLASRAGAALAVARANETKISAFSGLIEELKRANINVVGSVMNAPPLINVGS